MFYPTYHVGPSFDGMNNYLSSLVGLPTSGMNNYPRNLWGRHLTVCSTLGDTSDTVLREPGEFPFRAQPSHPPCYLSTRLFVFHRARFSTSTYAHYYIRRTLFFFDFTRAFRPESHALFLHIHTRIPSPTTRDFSKLLHHRSKPGTRRT